METSQGQVKGTVVAGVVGSLAELVEAGGVTREALDARLSRDARDLFAKGAVTVGWYPVPVYAELLDQFWELASGRDPAFMESLGRGGAEALVASGVYAGFVETSQRRGATDAESLLANARSVVQLNQLIYDGVRVTVEADEDRMVLEFTGVEAFSEAMFLSTAGFLSGMTGVIHQLDDAQDVRWQAERPSLGRFRFSIPIPPLLGGFAG